MREEKNYRKLKIQGLLQSYLYLWKEKWLDFCIIFKVIFKTPFTMIHSCFSYDVYVTRVSHATPVQKLLHLRIFGSDFNFSTTIWVNFIQFICSFYCHFEVVIMSTVIIGLIIRLNLSKFWHVTTKINNFSSFNLLLKNKWVINK